MYIKKIVIIAVVAISTVTSAAGANQDRPPRQLEYSEERVVQGERFRFATYVDSRTGEVTTAIYNMRGDEVEKSNIRNMSVPTISSELNKIINAGDLSKEVTVNIMLNTDDERPFRSIPNIDVKIIDGKDIVHIDGRLTSSGEQMRVADLYRSDVNRRSIERGLQRNAKWRRILGDEYRQGDKNRLMGSPTIDASDNGRSERAVKVRVGSAYSGPL